MFFNRSRQMSLRRFILLAGDAGCVVGAFAAAAYIRLKPTGVWWTGYMLDHLPAIGGVTILFLLVFYAAGTYERETITRRSRAVLVPLIATGVATALSMVLFYAWFHVDIGRGILAIAAAFVFVGTAALRHLYRIAVGYGLLSRNALIVGDGEDIDRVIDLLRGTDDAGFKVFGIVSVTRGMPGEFVHGCPVLGHLENLRKFVEAYEIETIIVSASRSQEPVLLQELRPLRYAGIELIDYAALYEELAEGIALDYVDDEWLMNAAMNSSVLHIRKIKRIMDIVVSVFGLVLLSPLVLLAALCIRLDSKGPIIYRQRRAQLEGKPYTLLKFRTMRGDAEDGTGAVWAEKIDNRVTRVGKLLRTWRIDEIPQLVNVLRGEMSLVGPRPERPELIDQLARDIPFYRERLLVLPGITGWAQVKFPYAASVEAARRKLQYDLYYNKHMGLVLDCQILLRTFKTIIAGIRHSDEDDGDARGEPDNVLHVLPRNDDTEDHEQPA